jgi:hypothetical protein
VERFGKADHINKTTGGKDATLGNFTIEKAQKRDSMRHRRQIRVDGQKTQRSTGRGTVSRAEALMHIHTYACTLHIVHRNTYMHMPCTQVQTHTCMAMPMGDSSVACT